LNISGYQSLYYKRRVSESELQTLTYYNKLHAMPHIHNRVTFVVTYTYSHVIYTINTV